MILTTAGTLLCPHGGQVMANIETSGVTIAGAPVLTQDMTLIIASRPLPANTPPGPCVSGRFMTGASRVTVMGRPVLLADSISTSTPAGLPMQVLTMQQRVRAR